MKKITKVTLLKDLPGIKAGADGQRKINNYIEGWWFLSNGYIGVYSDFYPDDFVKKYPDWFKVEYEEENSYFVELSISTHPRDKAGSTRGYLMDRLFLTREQAEKCGEYLVGKFKEYLQTHCKKCGGRLKCSSNGSDCDKDRATNLHHNCEINNLANRNCKYYRPVCSECGEVSHE